MAENAGEAGSQIVYSVPPTALTKLKYFSSPSGLFAYDTKYRDYMVDERLTSVALPANHEEPWSGWPHCFRLDQAMYRFTAMGDLISKPLGGEWRMERVFTTLDDALESMQPQDYFFMHASSPLPHYPIETTSSSQVEACVGIPQPSLGGFSSASSVPHDGDKEYFWTDPVDTGSVQVEENMLSPNGPQMNPSRPHRPQHTYSANSPLLNYESTKEDIDRWVDDRLMRQGAKYSRSGGVTICPVPTCGKLSQRPSALKTHLYFHFGIRRSVLMRMLQKLPHQGQPEEASNECLSKAQTCSDIPEKYWSEAHKAP
ncbi:unnamed protein product [Rhizoctonia solani]|uniref:C2H2-type domain-containing protein n=1 Tax=Rhizoctonia solani TaxID=456999 RepID=A0A8H3C1M7_9AGAM|nr:unnamed protein product [Rhizoctonia solani]